MNARHGGLVKPTITFFGEDLPKRFLQCSRADFPRCRLLLVFGTSLMVQPFASLVRFPPCGTPRFLINRERRGEDLGLDFDTPGSTDGCFLGDCDDAACRLASLLGWQLDAALPAAATAAAAAAATAGAAPSAVSPSKQPPAKSKLRLGLTKSATAKAAESVIFVEPSYEVIVRAAANKLKLPAKSIQRVVLRTSVAGFPPGTELPRSDDCSAHLKNEALLWVSTTSSSCSGSAEEVLDIA